MKVLVAGDYCPIGGVKKLFDNKEFSAVLGDIKHINEDQDYSIVNFECPVVVHESTPIDKCGPALRCSSNGLEALKWAKFDCVTLANNHFLDYGEVGVKDTLSACRANSIDYVGGGMNLKEASRILYKDVSGERLAIVNCCEREFSIATESTAGSNPLNIVQQFYAIQEAKKNADYVVIIIHGGVELFWLPSARMIETYRFFIDAGADAVINHHQHCYSGYEEYNGRPIFYGLGNFCFDGIGSGERWTSGFMVKIDFYDKDVHYELLPYRQCDKQIGVNLMKGRDKDAFFKQIEEYNQLIADDEKRETAYLDWCDKNKDMYKVALNPLYNRITRLIFDRLLGRKIISKSKLLLTKDMLSNESHIERVRLLVEQKLKDY